jgi:hypothetical protein
MHATTAAYQYLDRSAVAASRTVAFLPSHLLTAGSSRKAAQSIRLVKSLFRQKLKCVVRPGSSGIAVEFPDVSEAEILQLCDVVEQRLEQLRQQPLTARMVEEILSITAAERRRWTKDRRLPNAGHAFFSQGKKQVGLFVYPPELIRDIAAHPELISTWRQADEGGYPSPLHKESSLAR